MMRGTPQQRSTPYGCGVLYPPDVRSHAATGPTLSRATAGASACQPAPKPQHLHATRTTQVPLSHTKLCCPATNELPSAN